MTNNIGNIFGIDHMKGIDILNPVIYECTCGQGFDGATCLHCGKEYCSEDVNYSDRDDENLLRLYGASRALLDNSMLHTPEDILTMKRDLNAMKLEMRKRGIL